VLARVAENLYWLGRYLERADNVARLAEVNYYAGVDQGGSGANVMLAALGARDALQQAQEQSPGMSEMDVVVRSFASPVSLATTISLARNLAREVREHISREVFEEVNQLYLGVTRVGSDDESVRRLFTSVKRTVPAIIGLFDNTVLLTEGREWFRCGMFIERADMTSRIIDAKYFLLLPSPADVGGPLDRYQWIGVLRSASAFEAYRKRYRGAIQPSRVAELLMFDPEFPRSLVFSVAALERHYQRATSGSPPGQVVHAMREVVNLDLDLGSTDVASVIRDGLHEFLDSFQARLQAIDAALAEHVFRALPEEVAV